MRYYLGEYAESTNPHFPGRQLPTGAVGAVDLASLPAQSTRGGIGLFACPRAMPSEYTLVGQGDALAIKATAKLRGVFASLVGYAPSGDSLADCILDCLIGGADPDGADGPLPIMPNDRGWMELHLPGVGYVKGERFEWATTPHRQKVKAVLRRTIRSHFNDEQAGKLPANMSRKVLDAFCDKYKLQGADDWKEFVPTDLQKEIVGRLKHETTIADDFNRADSTSLGANWTEESGDLDISSNTLRHQNNVTAGLSRHNTALSSADHYSQIDAISAALGSVEFIGVCARLASGGGSFYLYQVADDTSDVSQMYKFNGTFTQLGSNVAWSKSYPDTVKCEANGSGITGYINGVATIGPITDTGVTGNLYAGVRLHAVGGLGSIVTADNFEASDLAPSGIVYTQLERSTRGLMRGTWTGGM